MPIAPRRSPLLAFVVASLLVLLALYMGYAAQTAAEPSRWKVAAGVMVGAALMIVILRLLRRRR